MVETGVRLQLAPTLRQVLAVVVAEVIFMLAAVLGC
jgi:hypothetical protein